jgi:hypothetical protein
MPFNEFGLSVVRIEPGISNTYFLIWPRHYIYLYCNIIIIDYSVVYNMLIVFFKELMSLKEEMMFIKQNC